MVWDGMIAGYLFLAGMGAGAFAFSALVGFVKPDAVRLRTIGYLIAPVAVVLGTLLLVIDARAGLHSPLRFLGLIANLSSVMAWGVLVLVAFLAVGVASLALVLVKKKTPKALDIVGLVCAAGVAAYTGLLLGAAGGFPLWNPFVLPLLFLVSAASSGFAAVLLAARVMKLDEASGLRFLEKSEVVLPIAEAVLVIALLVVGLALGGSSGRAAGASVASLLGGSYAIVFWLGVVVCGIVFPLASSVARSASKRFSRGATGIAGNAAALVGGFSLRYAVVMAAVGVSMGAML